MNRTVICITLLNMFCMAAFAQQKEPAKLPASKRNPVRIEFADTVMVANVNKDTLYNRSLAFIKKNFKRPGKVIKSSSQFLGKITGEYQFNAGRGFMVDYDIEMDCSDTGYYYSFFFVYYVDDNSPNAMRTLSVNGSSGIPPKDWIVVSNNILTTMTDLEKKLKTEMADNPK